MENPYELIYMSRTGDEWARKALFSECDIILKGIVNSAVRTFRPLEPYREEILLEARLAILDVMENYREDQACGFRTFLTVVLQRKVYSLMRRYSAPRRVPLYSMVHLDDQIGESGEVYGAVAQNDPMNDPVYYLNYTLARDRLRDYVGHMKPEDRKIMDTWLSGCSYEEAGSRLKMSPRSYGGKLQRIRRDIRNAVHNRTT